MVDLVYYMIGIYIIIINLIGFVIMGYDKRKAKNHEWRVRESTIFMIGFFGGCIGILLGMNFFRHKTKHKQFVYGIPLILFAQIFVIVKLF